MSEFESFSPLHFLALGGCVLIAVAAIFLLKKWRGTEWEGPARRFIGIGCLAVWLVSTAYRAFFLPFAWESSLPLQFCHLADLIGAVAVLGRWRLFQAVLYFWAFALCSWAFLTPELHQGPATAGFWIFWAYHVFIILAVVEILVLQKFQPTWSDFANSVIVTLLFAAFLAVLNRALGWDYGYVGPTKPDVPTLLDFLGPYPLRLLWMVLLGIFLFFLLMLPWIAGRRGGDADLG